MESLIFIIAVLLFVGLLVTGIERLPIPAKPAWLKGVIEGVVCICGALLVAQHFALLPS